MNKILKSLFVLVAIVPLICFCLAGCNKSANENSTNENSTGRQKIVLTTDNINEYLVLNYTSSPYGSSNNSFIINFTTSKRQKNIEFFDSQIQITCTYGGTTTTDKIDVALDYDGKSQCSFIPSYRLYVFKITSVSGYILID